MKWKYFLLLLIIVSSITVDAQPQNELGFGGGYFRPYTSALVNSAFYANGNAGVYILYDRNFNRKQHRFYPFAGVRTQMLLFSEERNATLAPYAKPVQNYLWPIIAMPIGIGYRQPLGNNSVRIGLAAGPTGTIFPGTSSRPELGWQAEGVVGYNFKQTTLSVRAIHTLTPYNTKQNSYKGTLMAVEAKFALAKKQQVKPNEELPREPVAKKRHGAVPAVEMGISYGKFQGYDISPRRYSHYVIRGQMSMLNVDCYFDRKPKGFIFNFGAKGSYIWGNDMYFYTGGGYIGCAYQQPVSKKARFRGGISMGPVLVLYRGSSYTNGWLQGDAFAEIQVDKRVSLGARYVQPFNKIEANNYVYENQTADHVSFRLQSVMLECKVRLSQSR